MVKEKRVILKETHKKLHALLVLLILVLCLIICEVPSFAQNLEAEVVYENIYQRYPDEVLVLNRYGARETDIISFVSGFITILRDNEDLNRDNFEKETVNTILSLYLSGEHIEVFDAVFNGWGLSSSILMDALDSGIDEVMGMLPESFKEIGRLVKKILIPSPDINGDKIVDLYDLVIVSKFYQCDAVQLGIPLGIDQNADGVINLLDLRKVALQMGINGVIF